MAKKKVKRLHNKSTFHPGDGKGFLLLLMSLLVVILSVLGVQAVTRSQADSDQVLEAFLGEPIGSSIRAGSQKAEQKSKVPADADIEAGSQRPVCGADVKSLDLKGSWLRSDCYTQADVACSNNKSRTFRRSAWSCLSQDQWQRVAEAYCAYAGKNTCKVVE